VEGSESSSTVIPISGPFATPNSRIRLSSQLLACAAPPRVPSIPIRPADTVHELDRGVLLALNLPRHARGFLPPWSHAIRGMGRDGVVWFGLHEAEGVSSRHAVGGGAGKGEEG
ncbi:LOW QUALITY PROTEIN: hypothetical protein CVT26_005293, partial [Gymnopilus dilepis]